ncbi:Ankyrin repeat-containing domain, partial [Trinorchestia longiramus]
MYATQRPVTQLTWIFDLTSATTPAELNKTRITFSLPWWAARCKGEGWTPLHYSAKMGHIRVVRLLTEAGARTKDKTNEGKIAICYAAAYDHVEVFSYLIQKEVDSYELLSDKKFVHDLTVMSRKYAHQPLQEYVLLSPAPPDIAHKLSHTLLHLSET